MPYSTLFIKDVRCYCHSSDFSLQFLQICFCFP